MAYFAWGGGVNYREGTQGWKLPGGKVPVTKLNASAWFEKLMLGV